VGYTDQQPMAVCLPVGTYLVYALSERHGQVEIPITIVANQLTTVHLQSPGMQETAGLPESALVRLPNGGIAGRRAQSGPLRPPGAPPPSPTPAP